MERKSWKLWILVVLAVVMVCVTAGSVADAEDNGEIQVILTEEAEEAQTASMDVDTERSTELFVDRAMYGTRLRGVTLKGASLTGGSKNLYDRLRADIIAVANGADGCDGSTVFVYSLDEIYSQSSFTEDDLHTAIVVNGKISDAATAAVSAKYASEMDFDAVTDCLMQDCVYELYWYDKTENGGCNERENYHYGAQTVNGNWVLTVSGQVTVSFAVSEDYAVITNNGNGTYSMDPYAVDVAKYGQAARQAAANAQNIVSAHENESNYQRLLSYKNAICTETDYNHDAAEDDDTAYGDPWQLVWVFDENPVTKVVCEGYSKAFKYLNDLSANTDVDVILAEGTMEGATGSGPHMWNIVRMEDGRNYMADITNCDAGSVGYPDLLFLTGPASGNVTDGYIFSTGNSSVSYVYSNNNYSEERITLDEHGYLYNQDHPACEHTNCEWEYSWAQGTTFTPDEWNWGHHITGTRIESLVCRDCGETLQTDSSHYTDYYESHTYNNQLIGPEPAVCEICGHVNTCAHEHTYTSYSNGNVSRSAITGDNYLHSVTGAGDFTVICTDCGMMIDQQLNTDISRTERHRYNSDSHTCEDCGHECSHEFDESGWCDACGYQCYHDGINNQPVTPIQQEGPFYSYDDEDHHCVYATKTVYGRQCPHCPYIERDWVSGEEYPETYTVELHTYEDGVCSKCGGKCSHNRLNQAESQAWNPTEPQVIALNEIYHVLALATGTYRICPDCGEMIFRTKEIAAGVDPDTLEKTAHDFDSNGLCDECGYQCPHESYTNGICDNCHKVCMHSYSSDTGICLICGYHCLHENREDIETTATEYEWASTTQHNKLTVSTSYYCCNDCRYTSNPVRTITEEAENHTDANNDGICDICQRAINGSFQYDVNSGILQITGNGATPNYQQISELPWFGQINGIERVVIDGDFTSIGTNVLSGLGSDTRIDFLQRKMPAMDATAITGVCRYYSTDESWEAAPESWIYLPYYDESDNIADLYRISDGWQIRPRSSEGYITIPVSGEQALEYTRIGRSIRFETTPTMPLTGDDLMIIGNWDNISWLCFAEGCGAMEITLQDTSILRYMDITGSKTNITIHDPRENGTEGRTIVNNGTLVYDGNLGELYLSGTYNYDGSLTTPHVTVNGNIEELEYFTKDSTNQPYNGDLTVSGIIRAGTIYGNKSLSIPGVTENLIIGGMAAYTFTDIQQADPIILEGDLNLTEENRGKLNDTGETTIDQFRKRYYISENNRISLDLQSKDPSIAYSGWINNVYDYNAHFTTDDIIYDADTEICICVNENKQIVFNGSVENGTKTGLADILVEPDLNGKTTAEVIVNCPVRSVHLYHNKWSKGAVRLQINDRVDSCEINVDQGPDTSISLGAGGSIGSGNWRRTLQGNRFFNNINGACDLFSNGRLNVLSAKAGETLEAILPSDATVTAAAGQEAMLDMSQRTKNDLSPAEDEALEAFLADQEQKEAWAVFDLSVLSVTTSADGMNTTVGEAITELNSPVPITVSNDTNGTAYVVRLHENEAGTVTAEQLCNETEDEVLEFESSLFSKYVIIAPAGSAPVSGWDYEYEADEKTLIISGTGIVSLAENETAPWLAKYPNAEIKRIVIGSGITGIGANVFAGFEKKVRIDFTEASMPAIDPNAFGETVAVCRYYNDDASWTNAVNTESVTWLRMPVLFQYGAGTYGSVSYQENSEHPGWSVYVQMNNEEVDLSAAQAAEVLNDSGDLMLFAIPTDAADQAVYSNVEKDYWCLYFFNECEGTFALSAANCKNLPNTIDMIAPSLSLTVTDTRNEGLRRLRMTNGQVEYNGRIQTLLLENSNKASANTPNNSVRVNGTVERLDYYGIQTEQPYRGTVTVQGAVLEGTEYGNGMLTIEGLDNPVETTGAPISTFSAPECTQATLIIDTGKTPAVQVATTGASISADMYNLRYVFQENGNIWLTLNPGEETNISGGMIYIDVKENTPDFSINDIIWGDRTTLYLSMAQGSDPVALNGKADAATGTKKGLKQLEVGGWTHGTVNCPVGHLAIQPDPMTHGDIDLTINNTVRSAYLQFNNCAGKITVGEGGSIQGNFRPPLRDIRGFGPVTGTSAGVAVVSDNALRVMSWKYSDGIHAILPSDNEVAQAWGGSGKAMIDLTDGSVQELTDEEMSVLATATGEDAQTLRKRIAKVFDLSVTSYTEANGNYSIGENISSLATAVPITISNDAGTDIMVVGLHRNGVALSANVLDGNATTITEDTIGFRTSEFSKYLVISNVDAPDYTNSYDYYFGTAGYQDGSIYGTDSIGYYYAPGIGPNGLGNSQPDWKCKHVSGPDCFTLEKEWADYEGSRTLMPNGTTMTNNTTDVYLITCTNGGQTSSWKTTIHMRDGSGLPKRTKLSYAEFDMATGRMSGDLKVLGAKLEAESGKTYKIKCEIDGELPEELEGGTSFYDANWAEETKLGIINAWDNGQYANQLAANEALVTVPATGEYVLCVDTSFWPSDYQSNVQNNLQSRWYVAVECWTADTPAFAEPDISVEICDDEYDSVLISLPWVDGASTHDISIYKPDRTMVYVSTWGQGDMQADKCTFQVNIVQGGQNRLMIPGEYYAEITLKGDGHRTTRFRRNFIVAGTGYSFNGFVIPSGTTSIEAEGFAGIPAKMVKIPGACTNIGSKAFDGSGLKAVYIPSTNIAIANDALPAGTLVYTPKGSGVAGWAATNGYEVIFTSKEPK